MALDHSAEGCKEALAPRATVPTRDVQSLAVEQIVLERLSQLCAEIFAENDKVHFVIQTERAVVDVGGPYERPASIHEKNFRVHHVGGVLPNRDAFLQKTAVSASPGPPHETMKRRSTNQKLGSRLMFWSGSDFDEPELAVVGKKFRDASVFFVRSSEINKTALRRWLNKARAIQWDYKNIVRRKGKLERLA
jgi:hypothetical protein